MGYIGTIEVEESLRSEYGGRQYVPYHDVGGWEVAQHGKIFKRALEIIKNRADKATQKTKKER
jgi:tetrahydromethanopterin S-methyltransferase subunit E